MNPPSQGGFFIMQKRIGIKFGIVMLTLWVTACSGSPVSGNAPTPGLIILGTQAAAQATQGAISLNAASTQAADLAAQLGQAQMRAAQATADESKRQSDLAYFATATHVINQAALDTLHISLTQAAAVATQNAEQRQIIFAVTAEYRRAEREQVTADIYLWGGALAGMIFVITVLFGVAGLLHALESFTLAVADERKAKAAQMLLATAINGGQLQFSIRDQAWEYLGLPEPEHILESVEADERPPIIVEQGKPVGVLVRNVTDAERLLVASLRAGYTQDAIAPATKIEWDGMRRRDAVNSLRPHVHTKEGAGGGTFIDAPYSTVAALLNAIRRGEITPAPTVTDTGHAQTVAAIVENS